jgi:hypothetical protein
MHVEDFARQYGTKTNEELLRLARDVEHLTPEASVALTGELAKREVDGTDGMKVFRRRRCGSARADILRRAVFAPVLSVAGHANGALDIDRDALLSRADCRWNTLGISIRSPLSASGHALDVDCARSGHYLLDPVCAASVCTGFGGGINKGRTFLRMGLSSAKPLF